MEFYIDKHLVILRKNLDHFSDNGEGFDFKELIAFFVIDVLGELAFSESFDSQTDRSPDKLPPINDHIYLACLMGMMPEMMPLLKAVAPWIPHPWLQRLFGARKQLRDLTARCVRTRLNEKGLARKDLLTCLINAVDPESGAKLTELDISTEAFAMVYVLSDHQTATFTDISQGCWLSYDFRHSDSFVFPHSPKSRCFGKGSFRDRYQTIKRHW